jgi:RimJ/RimL family protein N-acetyltransferase
MMNGPELATQRLELRWLTLDDAPLMLAVWNDPAFVRYVADRGIRTLEQTRAGIEAGPLRLYAEYGYGPFRVRRREEGVDMGICGLFRRDALEEPDIGFAILPEFCGRGYGFEAAAAVLEYAGGELGLPAVTAIVSPHNKASIGLLEKLGMSFERPIRMPGEDHDIRLYRIELAD